MLRWLGTAWVFAVRNAAQYEQSDLDHSSAFLRLNHFWRSNQRRGVTEATYTEDVDPIMIRHCATRHLLLSYETARAWARKRGCFAGDAALKFRDDARLSQQEINTLTAWMAEGAP